MQPGKCPPKKLFATPEACVLVGAMLLDYMISQEQLEI
jgi:hypothetical protein